MKSLIYVNVYMICWVMWIDLFDMLGCGFFVIFVLMWIVYKFKVDLGFYLVNLYLMIDEVF